MAYIKWLFDEIFVLNQHIALDFLIVLVYEWNYSSQVD
jgi:hypothetical protein